MIVGKPMGKRLVWAIDRAAALGAVALIVGGCCRTSGPAHKCDFTPIEQANDASTDGPMLCGTAVCEDGDVCCYKKAPAIALCIPPSEFKSQGCETLDLECSRDSECPGGDAVACCVKFAGETGSVTCRPTIACVAESGYLACENAAECPSAWPICVQVGETPQGEPFNVCR